MCHSSSAFRHARFARGAHAPGRNSVVQMRDGWKSVTSQADMQSLFSRLDEAVERGIERGVVGVLGPVVLGIVEVASQVFLIA